MMRRFLGRRLFDHCRRERLQLGRARVPFIYKLFPAFKAGSVLFLRFLPFERANAGVITSPAITMGNLVANHHDIGITDCGEFILGADDDKTMAFARVARAAKALAEFICWAEPTAAKQSAVEAKDPFMKRAFEEVEAGWRRLAEQMERIDTQKAAWAHLQRVGRAPTDPAKASMARTPGEAYHRDGVARRHAPSRAITRRCSGAP